MVPIQSLLSISELLPRLHKLGVRNVNDAATLLGKPELASQMLSDADLTKVERAIQHLIDETAFCQTFNWDLLAYSEQTQAEFAQKAQQVFESAYGETRLIYLSIPTRTLRALEQVDLLTVNDVLRAQGDLMEVRNLGSRSIGELFRILGQFARVYRYMLGNLWNVTQRRLTPSALLKAVIGPLNERERDIIVKRYGLSGDEMTLRETGDALGISRERARQIQNRTMEKLREGSSIALIDDWVDLHLPHLIYTTMLQLGGLATTHAIKTNMSTSGFSLALLCDILDKPMDDILGRQELCQVGDELWAINDSFAILCWDAMKIARTLGYAAGLWPRTDTSLSQVANAYRTRHPLAQKFPPSHTFLKLVYRHAGDFWHIRK